MSSFDASMIDPSGTYTLEEYATVARCSYHTAVRRAKAKKIPGARKPHGGGWRVPASALLDFVDRTEVPAVRVNRDRRSSQRIHAEASDRARAAITGRPKPQQEQSHGE